MRVILQLIIFVFTSFALNAQGSGDVAVIYHLSETNANGTAGDRIGLVLLAPITSGTQFKLTENGTNGTQLDTDEGIITINATTGHSFGKIINITLNNGALVSGTAGFTYTFSGGPYAISTGGDQSIVYRNAESAPTFIYTANFDGIGQWLPCVETPPNQPCASTACQMPPSGEKFSFGLNATSDYDNNWYSGPTSFTNKAAALAAITSTSNWSGDDTSGPAETAANALTGLGSLPVNWLELKISGGKDGNLLIWQTASEINNDYFEVQRSMDGVNYKTLGQVDGAGNTYEPTSYEFMDKTAKSGFTYYYRVKQVDFDGREDFSNVLSMRSTGSDAQITTSPNPTENILDIHLVDALEFDLDLDLIRSDGQIIRTVKIRSGERSAYLDLTELPNSIYFLKSKDSDLVSQKIIKSKF